MDRMDQNLAKLLKTPARGNAQSQQVEQTSAPGVPGLEATLSRMNVLSLLEGVTKAMAAERAEMERILPLIELVSKIAQPRWSYTSPAGHTYRASNEGLTIDTWHTYARLNDRTDPEVFSPLLEDMDGLLAAAAHDAQLVVVADMLANVFEQHRELPEINGHKYRLNNVTLKDGREVTRINRDHYVYLGTLDGLDDSLRWQQNYRPAGHELWLEFEQDFLPLVVAIIESANGHALAAQEMRQRLPAVLTQTVGEDVIGNLWSTVQDYIAGTQIVEAAAQPEAPDTGLV